MFYWSRKGSDYATSGATSWKELNENPWLFLSEALAVSFAKERIDTIKREEELLSQGHIRCAYCSKVIPPETAVQATIINFKMYGPQGKRNSYCSGECAHHDQCAHEG